jgi:hypothetical protein
MKTNIKLIAVILIMTLFTFPLLAYDLQIAEPAQAYHDLAVRLVPEQGDQGLSLARFYIIEEAQKEPLYLELEKTDQAWTGILPAEFVSGAELSYFAEVKTQEGIIHRIPEEGSLSVELIEDTTPPDLRLVLPEQSTMQLGVAQVIILEAPGEQSLAVEQILINDTELEDAQTFAGYIKAVYTPQTNDDVTLALSVADAAGNTVQQQFLFSVTGTPKPPMFAAEGTYYATAELTYSISGDQDGISFPGDLFTDLTHEITLDAAAGAEGRVKAGPLEITGTIDLADERDIREYFDSYPSITDYPYPSALISDVHDVLRLWNPYAFNYTDGYGTHARDFSSGNQFLLDIGLFGDIFHYRFGDQSINFQDQTVKDFAFRGSSLQFDAPILSFSVANGFSDLGESELAWPRAFLGLQFGLDALDYWYLQTNLSLISDYQGPYSQTKTGARPIADLFELTDPDDSTSLIVAPEQNLVFGLGTGVNTKWFTLKGEAGLSLYVSDAGDVLDLSTMLSDFGAPDISPTLNSIQSAFPVFDYFTPNDGYLSGAAGGTLWGVTYGADLSIAPLNLSGWFRKTDGSYKSLGASITNGILETGGAWDLSFSGWKLGLGYGWEKNNIPDIISNDLIPLVERFVTMPDLVDDIIGMLPTPNSVPEITHEAAVKLQSPNLGAFGRFGTGASFNWEKTDTDGVLSSPDYQEAFIIGAEAGWKSKTYSFDKLSLGINLETSDSYTIGRYTDGVQDNSTDWDFSAEAAMKIGYDIVSFSTGYSREWGTASDAQTVQEVKAALGFKDLWFDSIGIDGAWEHTAQTVSSAWVETGIQAGFSLSKTIGMLTTGIDFSTGFTTAADSDDEESSWELLVFGSVSL